VNHTGPLSSEVDIVSDCLALESARHEDRLRVQMTINPAAAEVQVPPMLLQSQVENALKHGIAPLTAGGDLTIRAGVVGEVMPRSVTSRPPEIPTSTFSIHFRLTIRLRSARKNIAGSAAPRENPQPSRMFAIPSFVPSGAASVTSPGFYTSNGLTPGKKRSRTELIESESKCRVGSV